MVHPSILAHVARAGTMARSASKKGHRGIRRYGRHLPRFRPTARLILLDPADRVLLFSAVDPQGSASSGGDDPPGPPEAGYGSRRAAGCTGESLEAAAVRELAEETGHVRAEADIGPLVATSSGLAWR
jgi:8-oxo-dGTP pyrophosphatase MutT (NUDIX family)